ncbi:RNA-directed DNA polymerase, eukaryota, reverse transcriptase zinc-binding domain protein [Tanacetum coccineum]
MEKYYKDRKELFDATKDLEQDEDVDCEIQTVDEFGKRNAKNEGDGGKELREIVSQKQKERILNNMDLKMAIWNIRGMSISDKQKEVRNIIKEENLQMCGVIETLVKYHNIISICKKVFGKWEFISNGEDNSRGCRIMVGWNSNRLNVWVIVKSKQCIFMLVETVCKKVRLFCTMVIISVIQNGKKKLWRRISVQKSITNGEPWVIMGDFNVTLKVEEHSNGSSAPNSEMNEFAQCVREIEVGDILSFGFHFTWTKSRGNSKCKTLKKLDRIIINEAFVDKFHNSSGIFLPYMISDHILTTVLKVQIRAWNKEKGIQFLGKKDVVTDFPTEKIDFPNKLSREEEAMMCRGVIEVEMKNAMFEIEDSKAPGPDGFTARFYKSAWSIIGKDICKAIQEFFTTGKLLGEIITNRLKGVLGKLVHESQSAFIAGRQIIDNILLTQELFKGYNRKPNIKKVAFKIDLQKAYDTISRSFLKTVLEQFGFPNRMVDWIMVCVSTTKFSININGEREGYFCDGRGMRQRDPMSPYLFTLVMEVFNIIIRKNISEAKEFKYHQGCKKAGNYSSMYSGLQANMSKSTVFFGGMTKAEQNIILDIIPFGVRRLPVKYLGVSLITKKITANDCKPLVEKVKYRILDWRNKALSYSGRLQLIASVLSAMKIYWDSVFLLPKNVIYEINNLLKGFLWCQGPSGPLCDIVTSREIYDVGLSIEPNIADLVIKYEGNWLEGWNCEYPVLNQYVLPIIHKGKEDEAIWVDKHGNENLFSVKMVWNDLIDEETKVDWLNTQERIAVWNLDDDMKCVFSKKCMDSIKHLFFTCDFTLKVWKEELNNRNAMEISQKAKIRWSIEGDENSKYFHGIVLKDAMGCGSTLTVKPYFVVPVHKGQVPIGVLNHLESIRRNFFYGVDGSDRKLAWIGWNMVLTSKKNGGLGVSSFFAHNRALLFKWVWRFLTDGSSLWTRFIKAIFGNKGALDTHKLIPRRSPWQDVILAIHSLQSKGINLMDFIQKKVGNGENTSFWDDSWLGEVALKVLYKRLYALEMCKSISVAEKMGHPSLSHSFRRMPRGGVEQENYGLLCSKVADLVLPNISDRWCWSLEGSQEFSVKSSRILIDNTILPKAEVPTRWLRVVPIKVNVHAWRVCLDKLPTRANLSLRGMDISSIACPLCNSAVESTSHIFLACPLARQVWRNFLIWWELEDVAFNSYNEWLIWIVNIRLHKQLKVFLEVGTINNAGIVQDSSMIHPQKAEAGLSSFRLGGVESIIDCSDNFQSMYAEPETVAELPGSSLSSGKRKRSTRYSQMGSQMTLPCIFNGFVEMELVKV